MGSGGHLRGNLNDARGKRARGPASPPRLAPARHPNPTAQLYLEEISLSSTPAQRSLITMSSVSASFKGYRQKVELCLGWLDKR